MMNISFIPSAKQCILTVPVRIRQKADSCLDILGAGPSPHVVRPQQLKGSQEVEGKDGGPTEEEQDHDQDQHVDHLQFRENLKKGWSFKRF